MKRTKLLCAFLAAAMLIAALVPSGGEAKTVIAGGLVQVNGDICTMRGKKIRLGDTVSFGGMELKITKDENK